MFAFGYGLRCMDMGGMDENCAKYGMSTELLARIQGSATKDEGMHAMHLHLHRRFCYDILFTCF